MALSIVYIPAILAVALAGNHGYAEKCDQPMISN